MNDSTYSLGKETEQVEFKKSTSELKEGVVSIASILNKHGHGKLYFGVHNNGTVIGQEVGDTTLRTISQAIGNHISPAIYPTISKESYGGRDIVVVEFEGTQQPYLAYNIPRIRVADEDLVMEQPRYEELMRKRDSVVYSWEAQKSKYTIDNIDTTAFQSYLQKAKQAGRISFQNDNPADVLTMLELADGNQLLNAGAALFVDCGINELQMAKFASDERLTFTDIRRFTGSMLDLIDKAVQYVIDAMDWRVEFDGGLERKEIPEIPVDAVREAVTNAFAHRLIESGQSVEIAVYRSFIDVYSPGMFPEELTPEMFIAGVHKPVRRNPRITRTLYYSKDMESFATGLKRIQDACDAVGCK
ncbi:MAG: putative DNA binding domain-containing protein, partial [Eggerthellaceae bacterium]|nr:putative DNA binding domain-containing protein [Eggerthellaceae bacterium]